LLLADRRALLTVLLQAPIIAGLVWLVAGSNNLRVPVPGAVPPQAGNVLVALVLGSIYAGASNAAREIVKERSILRREQNFGVSLGAYIVSKLLVLGSIAVVQAFAFVYLGTARQAGPARGVLGFDGRLELVIVVAMCGVCAISLGLLVSAIVATPDKASSILPIVLLAQFVLAGLAFPINRPVVREASYVMTARWGFSAAASTADVVTLRSCIPNGPNVPARVTTCLPLWEHTRNAWFTNMGVMAGMTFVLLVMAWFIVRRRDPARALAARKARKKNRVPQ
jgi:hypothetical protein